MQSARHASNLILLMLFALGALAAMFILVGLLGAFLLPLTLVFIFLLAVYFAPQGFSGPVIIGGIVLMFIFGFVANAVLASTVNLQSVYQSAIQLDSISLGMSDTELSSILGVAVLVIVISFAFLSIWMSAKRSRR